MEFYELSIKYGSVHKSVQKIIEDTLKKKAKALAKIDIASLMKDVEDTLKHNDGNLEEGEQVFLGLTCDDTYVQLDPDDKRIKYSADYDAEDYVVNNGHLYQFDDNWKLVYVLEIQEFWPSRQSRKEVALSECTVEELLDIINILPYFGK